MMKIKQNIKSMTTKQSAFLLALFVILGLVIYSNTFNVPFIFDDLQNISNNPNIKIHDLSIKSLLNAAFGRPCKNRPIAKLTYAFNYFFYQDNIIGYHVINILIHIINGILLFILFKYTCLLLWKEKTNYVLDRNKILIPLLASLLWFVCPVQTQAVTYIVQRMTSMSTMFYLLSLLMYLKWRTSSEYVKSKHYIVLSIVSGLLAVGSKEIAATLPFFILLYEFYFFRDLNIHLTRNQKMFVFLGLVVFVFIAFLFLGGSPIQRIMSGYETRTFTPSQRVLTEFRILIYYLTLLFYPHPSRLHLDYDFSLSYSLFDPISTLVSFSLIIGFLIMAVITSKKMRLFSFAIIWYFGNIAIESTIIPLELVYEHRNYLPSMFLFLVLVETIFRYAKTKYLRLGFSLLILSIIVIWSYWTWQRNQVWRSELTLWENNLSKTPQDARVNFNVGVAYKNIKDWDIAIKYYRRALDLNLRIDLDQAYNNLGVALHHIGESKEALKSFQLAQKINPKSADAFINIGNVYQESKRYNDAITYYTQSLEIQPDYEKAKINLASVLEIKKTIQKTLEGLNKELEKDPYNYEVMYKLALVHLENEEPDETIDLLSNALTIQPKFPQALMKLGSLFVQKKEYAQAVDSLKKLHDLQPKNAVVQYNIACLEARQGHIENAENWLKRAVESGYSNIEFLLQDEDLKLLRDTAYYQSLISNQ